MVLAGLGYIYLVFSNLAERQSAGTLPLMLLFLPVGVGLASGSRVVCRLGRVCMWLLILLFVVIALALASGFHATGSPEATGLAATVWLVLAVTADTLLRVRIRWRGAAA